MSRQKNKMRLRRLNRLPKPVSAEGIYASTRQGFGFVETADHGSIFIPVHGTGCAIDGDRVSILITEPHNPLGPAGKIIAVLERTRSEFVGVLSAPRVIQPADSALPPVKVSGGLCGAKKGDWVSARLLPCGGKYTETLKCEILSKLGRSATLAGDLLAVVREFNLPEPYTPEAEARAAAVQPVGLEREDLTDLFTVTIDPPDAHDFDDAVSIREDRFSWHVFVHIADVAAFIRPGSSLDKAASERGFSSYIPCMFRPMLPKTLTSRISLRQEAVSAAHTVELVISKKDGHLRKYRRVHSDIRVDHRLDYPTVQRFIEKNKSPADWDDVLKKNLRLLADAAQKMRTFREEVEHTLSLECAEIKVLCSEKDGTVTGIERRTPGIAEAMIEECMLAANTAVAQELSSRGIPGLYRIHPDPEPEKLEEFEAFATALFRKRTGDLSVRENLCRFLKQMPDDHTGYAMLTALIRAMARALYSEEPAPHFGLGKLQYSHFTSPIRRYSDLFTHQQLLAFDRNKRMHTKKFAGAVAARLIKQERRNDEAFFAASDRLKLHYLKGLQKQSGNVMFSGVVIKITNRGMICDIPDLAFRVFVPESSYTTVIRHHPPQPGHLIYLYPDKLDFFTGRAEFKPVQ